MVRAGGATYGLDVMGMGRSVVILAALVGDAVLCSVEFCVSAVVTLDADTPAVLNTDKRTALISPVALESSFGLLSVVQFVMAGFGLRLQDYLDSNLRPVAACCYHACHSVK